jgi:predicted  nucleic acid-binding Zn-ribbon protein
MFNLEADIIARIESLELEIRAIRRQLEHTANMADKRVLDRQIGELTAEIALLKDRITPRPPRLTPIKP